MKNAGKWHIAFDLDHGLPFAKHEAGFTGKIHGVIFLFQLWTLKNLAKTSPCSVPALRICDTGAPASRRMLRRRDDGDFVLTLSTLLEPLRAQVRALHPGLSKPRHRGLTRVNWWFTPVLIGDDLICLPKLPGAPASRSRSEVSRLADGEARRPMPGPGVGAANEVRGAGAGTSTDRAKPGRLAVPGRIAFVKFCGGVARLVENWRTGVNSGL